MDCLGRIGNGADDHGFARRFAEDAATLQGLVEFKPGTPGTASRSTA
jgi:hypothetical protein